MKIVVFSAGGPFGLYALESLLGLHEIAAVVRPADPAPVWRRMARVPARWLRLRHRDVLADRLRGTGIPSIEARRGEDAGLVRTLERLAPDLVCIATFPWLLSPRILAVPRHGVVNVHPSYLPRHRGPNPLFWTYYHDDRSGGVSVHLAEATADSGPILLQQRIEIPRGWPSSELYLAAATAGAALLRLAVEGLERGTVQPVPQVEELATRAPRIQPGTPMIDHETWDVERTWHFLAGLDPWYKEPLTAETGRPARYGAVLGFERGAARAPLGRVCRTGGGWALACRDGEVILGRPPRLPPRVQEVPLRGQSPST